MKRRSQAIGSKHQRKLRKYSLGFHEKFNFYLKSYRSGILIFCGSNVEVEFSHNSPDARESFRMFDDGQFKGVNPVSKHPNLLKSIIIAKKAWGLWVDQWTDGVVDWSFTQEEILSQFSEVGIQIPDSFLLEFSKMLEKKKLRRNFEYLKTLQHRNFHLSCKEQEAVEKF